MSDGWSGAVLCGGRSRRMGRDKALIRLDGEPMARRVATALTTAGADDVVAVGGDTAALADLGLTVVPDQPELFVPRGELGTDVAAGRPDGLPVRDAGPLVGILTALGTLTADIVVVVACDLLAPSAEAMSTTAAALAATPTADLAVPRQGGRHQWLHAAWRRTARPRLLEQLLAGERSIHGAVAKARLELVVVDTVEADAVADADTPSDLPPQVDRSDK